MTKQILFGTIVGVLSSATQSVGLTLQRKSHILEELRPSHRIYRPPYNRSLWRWGFLLFLIANLLGSSIQITTLPLIILSPLQAVGLVFNSVCASVILEEGFSLYSIVGTVLVGVGALLIAFFGSIDEPNHNLEELMALMSRKPFVLWIWSSLTAVVMVLVWITVMKMIQSAQFDHGHLPMVIRPVFQLSSKRFRFWKGCLYGAISGTLSAHSLLLAKSSVELLLNALVKSNYEAFENVRSWLIIGVFFVLALTQLAFLNKGLRSISTSVLYPLVFCVYNITNIINGLVFYNQLDVLSKTQTFMIICGTGLVLVGVFALSWRLEDVHDEENQVYKDCNDIHERTPLMGGISGQYGGSSLLDDDDEETTGYVSFGSPRSMGKADDDYETTSTPSKRSTHLNDITTSPISNFKGFGLLGSSNTANTSTNADQVGNTSLNSIGGRSNWKRSSRRVLSYEQNELLAQLNQMPDFP